MDPLVLLFGWVIFSYAVAAALPLLLFGLGELLAFLIICVAEAVRLALLALLWLVRTAARILARGGQLAFRKPPEREHDEEADDETDRTSAEAPRFGEAPTGDPYILALMVLGLKPGFTRTALKRAYRSGIRTSHPDRPGGSTQAAQAVNNAYDLILQRHGWTR